MKRKSYLSLAFTAMYIIICLAAKAGGQQAAGTFHHGIRSELPAAGKTIPPQHDAHHPASHGHLKAPYFDEVPHILKFHKERVKKIKRHHGKCWLLTKVLLALCHISILVIGYLHVTH